jgi:digeranylgeranylglycerophospholipid reductase
MKKGPRARTSADAQYRVAANDAEYRVAANDASRMTRGTASEYRVAIVGAGPAGLQTAIRLKELGVDPIVFEEHRAVGAHKLCAGLISRAGVDALGLPMEECVQNTVRGAKIFSPDGTMLKVERADTVAYVVDRKLFDQALLKKARLMGISVCTDARLMSAEDGALAMRVDGRNLRWKADVVVGADGAGSTTRRLAGLDGNGHALLRTAQALCAGRFDQDYVEVHLGGSAKGFFAWVIPMGDGKAKIGLGIDGAAGGGFGAAEGGRDANGGVDCPAALRAFISQRVPDAAPHRIVSGVIPFGPPLPAVQARAAFMGGDAALVGDAAFQVKATSGGGIVFGMKAGRLLADSIVDHFRRGTPLAAYQRRLAPINRELRIHWKIRSWFNALPEPEIDATLSSLKKSGIEEFLSERGDMDAPSRFVRRMAVSPSFWFMARTLVAIATA